MSRGKKGDSKRLAQWVEIRVRIMDKAREDTGKQTRDETKRMEKVAITVSSTRVMSDDVFYQHVRGIASFTFKELTSNTA